MKLFRKSAEQLINITEGSYMSKLARDTNSGVCTVRKSIDTFEKIKLTYPRTELEFREQFIQLTEKGIKIQNELLVLKSLGIE